MINDHINKLQADISVQDHFDKAYADLVNLVRDEMIIKLNHRQVTAVIGHDNKKRKTKKP